MAAHSVIELVAGIAVIGEDVTQPWMAKPDRLEQVGSSVAMLNFDSVDLYEDQEAARIGDDVTLAPFELLARVKAAIPPVSVVLALWLSMLPAVSWASFPSIWRAAISRSWLLEA